MKGFIFKLILCLCVVLNAQNSEDFESFSEIKTYKYFPKKSAYYQIDKVNNSKIVESNYYLNRKLKLKYVFEYNDKGKLIKEFIKYDFEEGYVDLLLNEYKYFYNNNKQLIRKENKTYSEFFSKFNLNNEPQIIIRKGDFGISIPQKEELKYDSKGNVIEERLYFFTGEEDETVEYNKFVYDEYNNIIKIERQFIPEQNFPILITGGRSLFQKEEYSYKYNKQGLWVKKYLTVNGKRKLIEKRRFM